jgi:hypothetical protein
VNDHLLLDAWPREKGLGILRSAIFIRHVAKVALMRITNAQAA